MDKLTKVEQAEAMARPDVDVELREEHGRTGPGMTNTARVSSGTEGNEC